MDGLIAVVTVIGLGIGIIGWLIKEKTQFSGWYDYLDTRMSKVYSIISVILLLCVLLTECAWVICYTLLMCLNGLVVMDILN